MNRPFLLLALMCLQLFPDELSAQSSSGRGEIRIMWYNVENLFHPTDDTLQGDDEFTPEGVRHWTHSRYRKKIANAAKVIVAAGLWEPPDVVGLGEIEEARVLEDLVQHPILQPYNFRYLHTDSPDRRGMDVACLYRENRISLVQWNAYSSPRARSHGATRDIMHFCGTWRGKRDTLDLFLVHFISRYGGTGATADYRRTQAGTMVHLVDSVQRIRSSSLTVMAGDFNAEFEGYSLEPFRMGLAGGDSIRSIHMEGPGSYKYRGRWSRIDQFLVCGPAGGYHVKGFILNLPVLLIPDDTYGGMKPARTYEGYSYRGGVSDHLPILLDISHRPFSTFSEQ